MATTVLPYSKPISTATLMQQLQLDFPDRKIRKIAFESGFQVRKRAVTFHSVTVKPNMKKGTVSVTSVYDMLWVFFFIGGLPLIIYMLCRRKSYLAYKQSVIDQLKKHLAGQPANGDLFN